MTIFIRVIQVLAAIVCLLHLQSCDPDRPNPDDKFYCKVNGEHWKNDNGGDFKLNSLQGDLLNEGHTLYINARNSNKDQTITLLVVDATGIKKQDYELSIINSDTAMPPAASFYKGQVRYSTNHKNSGRLHIKSIETISTTMVRVIAEFEYTATNPSGDIVRVTNGKFNDIVRVL